MTLIIGFVCDEGIVLVSDTRVTNLDTQEFEYQSKVTIPLANTPFMVGAAGYASLFREFNRKLPDVTTSSVNKIKIQNIRELMNLDMTREEAINYLNSLESSTESQVLTQSTKHEELQEKTSKINTNIPMAYVYSAERFIDDCKNLIKEISKQVEDDPDSVELLIGIKRNSETTPSLHRISANGDEEEIDTFTAIGSGSPYVRMFFERLFDPKKPLMELVTLAFRTIIFVNKIGMEQSVGYDEKHPIEAYAVLNNGEVGSFTLKNTIEIIKDLENEMSGQFEIMIKNSKVNPLIWG
jgi:20S proteasome alpha/beta subunit